MDKIKAKVEMDIYLELESNSQFNKDILLEQLKTQLNFAQNINIVQIDELKNYIIDAEILKEEVL